MGESMEKKSAKCAQINFRKSFFGGGGGAQVQREKGFGNIYQSFTPRVRWTHPYSPPTSPSSPPPTFAGLIMLVSMNELTYVIVLIQFIYIYL